MAQAGSIFPDIDPNLTSGTQLATLLNDFKDAVVGGFFTDTGTRPTNLAAKGYWIDTQSDPIWSFKIYNGTTDQEIYQLNTSTGAVTFGSTSSPLDVSRITDDSLGAIVNLVKGRITGDQALDGDIIGEVNFTGTTDAAAEEIMAQIKTIATDNVTAAAHGSDMTFSTTPDAGASLTERVRIKNDGKVGFGTNAPSSRIHASGNSTTGGIKSTISEDSAVGATFTANKKRVAGSGQSLTSDVLGNYNFSGTDQNGAEVVAAKIKATASENSQDVQHGSTLAIQTVKTGETALGDRIQIDGSGNVTIPGKLTVSGDSTTVNTATLDVEDTNITVNKGGNDASSEGAGVTVERTGTDGSIVYEDALTSKFKLGALGSEVEVADISSAQTFTNKILTGADIRTPVRSDVKQDTAANLATYASSASNGQHVYATDTKRMYIIEDNALVLSAGGADVVTLTAAQTLSNKSYSDATTHTEITTPSTPASSDWKLYFKTDGLYQLDDAGVETNVSTGAAAAPWTDGGALDINGTTTDPTKGTTTADKFWYKIVDSNTLHGIFEYEQTSAGTAGSGEYIITAVPSGWEIDVAMFDRTGTSINDQRAIHFGSAFITNNFTEGGASTSTGHVVSWDETQVRILDTTSTSAMSYWGSSIRPLTSSPRVMYAFFTVPIVAI